MNDYRSWRPQYRAMCPEPGPLDQFLVVVINGKRVTFQPVTAYAHMRAAAERLATEHQCQVKVLPMTGSELMRFCGIEPDAPKPIDSMEPELKAQAVQNCMDVLRASVEPRERDDALDMLRTLGVLNA